MAMSKIITFSVILCLSAMAIAVAGRVVGPLLQFQDKPSFLRPTFSRIFDTSMYGTLQLNNGLAQMPQMG